MAPFRRAGLSRSGFGLLTVQRDGRFGLIEEASAVLGALAVVLALAIAPPAQAAHVRVRWEHATAVHFNVYVSQPVADGHELAVFGYQDITANEDGAFAAVAPVANPLAAAYVAVTALDALGNESLPSTVSVVSPRAFCGVTGCDDVIGCTVDLCTTTGGCLHLPNSVRCGDGNPCTDEICDGRTGCEHVANLDSCDDGRSCTVNDACFSGDCAGAVDCPGGAACDLATGRCDVPTIPAGSPRPTRS